MKKASYLCLALAFLLAGCTQQEAAPKEQEALGEVEQTAASDIPSYYDGYILNPQITDDRALQEPGQRFQDKKGELELKSINKEGETFSIGGIELTIHDAKILEYQPDYSLTDFYHPYTHEEQFPVAKFFVEIKNTTDQPLKFAPAAIIKASADEEKTWEDDIYLEELNGEIAAGESKKGNIGVLIEQADVKSIVITTSDLFNGNDEKIADAKEIKIEF